MAVEGALIRIAFDEMGNDLVHGFEATSDATGRYRINVSLIPKSKNAANGYFLIVEKEGYQKAVQSLGIYRGGHWMENTVHLVKEP